jgi:hypothetical protein
MNKASNISDAEIISETPIDAAADSDLHAAMGAPTEQKAPTLNSASSNWNFSDEPIEEEAAQTETTEQKPEPDTKEKPNAKTGDHKYRLSAETATLMYDQALQIGCNLRINQKFNKKFTKDEKNRILEQDLEDRKLDELDEADKLLKRKWDRYSKKKTNKINAIPLNEQETKNVTDAFYQYFKVKQIELPPEWVLAFAIGGTTIDRIIETEAD